MPADKDTKTHKYDTRTKAKELEKEKQFLMNNNIKIRICGDLNLIP